MHPRHESIHVAEATESWKHQTRGSIRVAAVSESRQHPSCGSIRVAAASESRKHSGRGIIRVAAASESRKHPSRGIIQVAEASESPKNPGRRSEVLARLAAFARTRGFTATAASAAHPQCRHNCGAGQRSAAPQAGGSLGRSTTPGPVTRPLTRTCRVASHMVSAPPSRRTRTDPVPYHGPVALSPAAVTGMLQGRERGATGMCWM
jgi:hypothetical protein